MKIVYYDGTITTNIYLTGKILKIVLIFRQEDRFIVY
jgi:hypothetical protein